MQPGEQGPKSVIRGKECNTERTEDEISCEQPRLWLASQITDSLTSAEKQITGDQIGRSTPETPRERREEGPGQKRVPALERELV